MSRNSNPIVNLLIIVGGAIGIGYGVGAMRKVKGAEEVMQDKIDKILSSQDIDIQQKTVDAAIEKHIENRLAYSLDKSIKNACDSTARRVENKVYTEIHDAARDIVTKEYQGIADEAKRSMIRDIQNISTEGIRQEVIAEGKRAMAEKLDHSMDDILNEFNGKLNSVSTIYESIAKSISSR